MSDTTLQMAHLMELNTNLEGVKDGGKDVTVQFNPETLKLAYANEVQQPEAGDQAGGTAGQQFVGAGSTTLTVTLWFDVTAMESDPLDDVRRLTDQVLFFMTPKPLAEDDPRLVPPGVRFQWAGLIFDGLITSLEENLEFFSPQGKPLRANMALSFTQQKILVSSYEGTGVLKDRPGARPLKQAKDGDSVQKMAGDKGQGQGQALGKTKSKGWQGVAAANRIEDPLRLPPGKLLDLNARLPTPKIPAPRSALNAASARVPAGLPQVGSLSAALARVPAGLTQTDSLRAAAAKLPKLRID